MKWITALHFLIILSAYNYISPSIHVTCGSGAVDVEDVLHIRGKFGSELWERIQVLNLTEPETYLPLIIRLTTNTTGLNNTQMEELKNYVAHLLTNNHNSTVYSVCRVLPFIMAKVPVTEAEKIALYDFVESIGDGDRKGYFALNVSRSAIKADYVNTSLGFNGLGVRIAIVDSGIDINHPDLNDLDDDPTTPDPKVLDNVSFFDLNDDGNPDEGPGDNLGHGTHVAGVSAGTGEASNYRFVGVAPGAWIMNIKVGSTTGLEEDDAINGIDYAVSHGADVISISFVFPSSDGTSPVSQAVDDAVEDGVVVTAGVGNDGPDSYTIGSPADAFNVIAVGAVDDNNTSDVADDVLLSLSSRGPTNDGRPKPDVVAPGVRIISCRAAGTDIRCPGWDTYISTFYIECTGTSMATPHVAGTVALMLQANPNLTPAQVKAILRQTARLNDDLNQLTVDDRGHGIIDAFAAVQLAQNVGNIQTSQMYDSWDVSTPSRHFDIIGKCWDYLTFTVRPPSSFGISILQADYHWRDWWGLVTTDYRLLWRMSAQHVWIDGTYYNLGIDMNKYLFSGPRIYEKGDGYVEMRAWYQVGSVMVKYYWYMHVDEMWLWLQYYAGSSWKTLIYLDTNVWDTTNYPYLPSTSETVLIERKITGDVLLNIRDLDHTEYVQIHPYADDNPVMWILRYGYFGNNPDAPTAKNDEYVYNRNIVVYYQGTSNYPGGWIFRKTDALPAPNPTQNDAGTGGDAGNTFIVATPISSGSYNGILCNSESDNGNDYYKFNVTSDQYIYASMTPPCGINFDLQLYNPSNNLKTGSYLGGGTTDSIFFKANSTGQWRIRINTTTGEAQYSFYLSINSNAYAMKTLTNGYFYMPYVATDLLKIEMLFDNQNLTGDQTGGTSPYSSIPNYPDRAIDMKDLVFIINQFGTHEGDQDWNYMADIVPDKKIDIKDQVTVIKYYGKSGTYITDVVTGVAVIFSTGATYYPDTNGFVTIPSGATSFNVTRSGTPIGAMVIFWEP